MNVELLSVDDLIGIHNFLNNFLCFLFVHFPDFLETVVVGLFEAFELFLQLLKLLCELLKFTGVLQVLAVEFSKLLVVGLLDFSDDGGVPLLSSLEHLTSLQVDRGSLVEDLCVEVKLLLVESVDGLHVLHTFLQNLHFFLQLNFLLGLIVSILRLLVFKILRVLLFTLSFKFEELLLGLLVLLE